MPAILQKDEKILRKKAKEVPQKDIQTPEIEKIIKEMKKALGSQADGVAIAAPQLGVSLRIFIVAGKVFTMFEKKDVDLRKEMREKKKESLPPPPDRIFINPKIIKSSREKEWVEEGCLSVRYLYGRVHRSKKTRIKAFDEKGIQFEIGGSGLLAQIFQHENDHLDGILFTDKAKDVVELTEEEYERDQR